MGLSGREAIERAREAVAELYGIGIETIFLEGLEMRADQLCVDVSFPARYEIDLSVKRHPMLPPEKHREPREYREVLFDADGTTIVGVRPVKPFTALD